MGGGQSLPKIQYTREVPNSAVPGSSPIYRHLNSKDDLSASLPWAPKTLQDNFVTATEKYWTCMCLGTRQSHEGKLGEYLWKTYYEIRHYSRKVGFGLHHLGLTETDEEGHSFIGIYSKNREEWMVTDFACISQSITSVPLYDVQQLDSISMIADQTQMRAVVCPDKLAPNLLKLRKEGELSSLRCVITFEPAAEGLRAEAEAAGLKLYSLHEVSELVENGEEHPPSPESWFTICYTSGTTGKSKGAVITHRNMISMMAGAWETGLTFSHEDSYLSYLPLAHMMERAISHMLIGSGAGIGYFGGDVQKLKEDLAALRPTLFVSVPRLYCRFYDAIRQMFSAAKGVKEGLIKKALRAKEERYVSTGVLTHSLWDKIVFNKVKAVMGGRVRLMITGSAPIAGDILQFLRVVFSCPLIEGYGQTETCAGSVLTNALDVETGIIGGPISVLELKLTDVPDMEYFSTDRDASGRPTPRGEICMRGPPVFQGYYKAPELTEEALDNEGWLHSGDIGMVLPHNGAFKIIDRKKNFFKLAQGEYVAAEKIEIVYSKSFYVGQIFVYGDSLQSYLVAIVVPEEAYVRKEWANEHGYSAATPFEEMCRNKKLTDKIVEDMNKKGKEGKLLGFEAVKKIHLEPVAWTPEDLLTPTQKLMRFQAKKKYIEIIQKLYEEPLEA